MDLRDGFERNLSTTVRVYRAIGRAEGSSHVDSVRQVAFKFGWPARARKVYDVCRYKYMHMYTCNEKRESVRTGRSYQHFDARVARQFMSERTEEKV